MKKLLFLLFLSVASADAANLCVGPASSGNQSGSDWLNKKAWSATPVRGDTWYLEDGSYTSKTFSTAASGTTLITIKKATVADHVVPAGWSDTMGDGQALFTNQTLSFSTPYWIMDGVVGSGSDPSTYGIYLNETNTTTADGSNNITPVSIGGRYQTNAGNNLLIQHVAVTCPGDMNGTGQQAFGGYGSNVTLRYCYANNCQGSVWSQGDALVVDHFYFGYNWYSAANHGNQIQFITNGTVSNSYFSYCNSQCVEPGGGSTTNMSNAKFFGNVIKDVQSGNGFCKGVSSSAIFNSVFYNNTSYNNPGPILYQNNDGLGSGSGNIVKNNLFVNSDAGFPTHGGGAITHSHNITTGSSADISAEAGGVVNATISFVNAGAGDFRLTANTAAGTNLGSPYNVDPYGLNRATWTRGANEYGPAGTPTPTPSPTPSPTPPAAPTNLRIEQ